MKKHLRIYVEQFPNEDIRDLHMSLPLSAKQWERFTKVKPKGVERFLKQLHRLQEIGLNPYGIVSNKVLRIERNKAFSWDETITAVVRLLEKYHKTDADVSV